MIHVFVPGTPVAQGSMVSFRVGEHNVITDQKRKQLKPWRDEIAETVRATGVQFGDQAVAVRMEFVLARGKTVKRPFPSVKPDGDKLARACGDALTQSACIRDDAQIVDLHISKRYGEQTGVHVSVWAAA